MIRFREWLARLFISTALTLVTKSHMEGFMMTVFDELAKINARLAVLEGAPTVDTSTFATAADLTALSGKVDEIRAELGTPPADATA